MTPSARHARQGLPDFEQGKWGPITPIVGLIGREESLGNTNAKILGFVYYDKFRRVSDDIRGQGGY